MSWARALRERRLAIRGLSRRRLSFLAGLSNAYVEHVESGRREPSREALRKLAPHLGVTAAVLTIESLDEEDGVGEAERAELVAVLTRPRR